MKKEILEKLQEIGFNPEPPILETILEALPNAISTKRGPAMFAMRKNSIFYEIERENKVPELAIGELKNESNWADTAAKMLLKLVEKGILNFNKREEGK